MRKLLLAMAVGAVLAWLFDPDSGSRRRAALRRKLEANGPSAATPPPVPSAVTDYTPAAVATIPSGA